MPYRLQPSSSMKSYILIFALLFLSGCASQASSVSEVGNIAELTPTIENSNSDSVNYAAVSAPQNASNSSVESKDDYEKFRIVPEEFKLIDFKNFTYPTGMMKGKIEMKNGGFVFEDRKECDNHFGDLKDVFYLDLKGDRSKTALVIINDVACGCGSCDGGSHALYLYDAAENKPELLWKYQTGSTGFGDGMKFLSVADKRITLEFFEKLSDEDAEKEPYKSTKFRAKNVRRETFAFNGKTFAKIDTRRIATNELDVKNYKTEIVIE